MKKTLYIVFLVCVSFVAQTARAEFILRADANSRDGATEIQVDVNWLHENVGYQAVVSQQFFVEYGLTESFGSQTPKIGLSKIVCFTAPCASNTTITLTGLQPKKTYYYRVVRELINVTNNEVSHVYGKTESVNTFVYPTLMPPMYPVCHGDLYGTHIMDSNMLYGMKTNYRVKCLQLFLNYKGYLNLSRDSFGVVPTGNFFGQTLAAVKRFQADHGLPATGYVGPMTRNAINVILMNEY